MFDIKTDVTVSAYNNHTPTVERLSFQNITLTDTIDVTLNLPEAVAWK